MPPAGLLGGPYGRRERPRQVVGGQCVPGECGGHPGGVVPAGEQLGEPGVQPYPFAREQVVVHGLPEQGVAEGVGLRAGRRIRDEQVVRHRLPQARIQIDGGELGRVAQQVVGNAPLGQRGHPQHLPRRWAEPVQPGQQHVGQSARQPVGPRRDELLGVEGVALAAGGDPAQGGLVDAPGGRPGPDQRQHGVGRERPELDPTDGGQPDELRQRRAQWMPAVQVVGAVGAQHQQPLRAQPGEQEGEQLPGGAVRPVQVLQHDQQRRRRGRVAHGTGHRVEHLQAPGVPVPCRGAGCLRRTGQQPVQHRPQRGARPVQRAEHLGEGQVGECGAALVQTPPDGDLHARLRGGPAERGGEPGLADPRLPGEQYGAGPPGAGRVEVAEQPGELLRAADQLVRVRAGGAAPVGRCRGHGAHRGTGHRHSRAHDGGPGPDARLSHASRPAPGAAHGPVPVWPRWSRAGASRSQPARGPVPAAGRR